MVEAIRKVKTRFLEKFMNGLLGDLMAGYKVKINATVQLERTDTPPNTEEVKRK